MVLWVVLALLTGAAVVAVLWPLSGSRAAEPDVAGDVAFYKDQIAEIARDEERGLIGRNEAEAARIEAGRRLLKASARQARPSDVTSEPALRRRRAASALALSVVPIVALAVYGGLGSPQLASRSTQASLTPPAGKPDMAPDMATALAKVEQHLAANPNDARGWDVIAPVYLRVGRYSDAARAYAQARRLAGDTLDRLLGHGEALVSAEGGVVTTEAREVFDRAVALDSSAPAARYYLALAAEQGGDHDAAKRGYQALIDGAKPDAPWLSLVRNRLARLEGGPAVAVLPSSAVTPEISAMVEGLDARLASRGGTEAEWSRLVRSFAVLGRRDDALDRFRRARTALAGDSAGLARLDQLAGELGLLKEAGQR